MKKNILSITVLFFLNITVSFAQKLPKIPMVFSLQDSLLPVKDQGDRDACASFAFTSMIEYALKNETGMSYNLSEQYYIYHLKHNRAKDEYTDMNTCGDIALDCGFVQEAQWAYQTSYFTNGFPCQNEIKNDTSAPYFCYAHQTPPAEFQKGLIQPSFLFTMPAIYDKEGIYRYCELIYQQKKTYIIAYPTEAFNNAHNNQGIINFKDTFSYDEFEELPMHFALIVGYDLDKEVFIVQNSWGTSFGNNGYGTISFKHFLKRNRPTMFGVRRFKINKKKIPNPIQPIALKVKQFHPSFEIQTDKTIILKLDAEVDSLGTKRIELRTRLMKVTKKGDSTIRTPLTLSEEEKKQFKFNYAGKNFTYQPDSFSYNLKLQGSLFNQFYLSQDLILCQTVQNALKEAQTEIFIDFDLICSDDINFLKKYASKSFQIDKSMLLKVE